MDRNETSRSHSERMRTRTVVMNGCVLTRTDFTHRPDRCPACPAYTNPARENRLDADHYCLDRIAWLDWMGWKCRKATPEDRYPVGASGPEPDPVPEKSFSELLPEEPWTGKRCGCTKPRRDFYEHNPRHCKACLSIKNSQSNKRRKLRKAGSVCTCKACGKPFKAYTVGLVLCTWTCKRCYSQKTSAGSKLGWARKRSAEDPAR